MTSTSRIALVGATAGAGIAAVAFALGRIGASGAWSWWAIACAVLIGAAGGWSVGQWLARRLALLIAAASDLAHGRRARVPTDEAALVPDEIGRLAAALRTASEGAESRGAATAEDRTRFGAVLAGMVEGVMVLDRAGRILLLNPAMERMLGVAASRSVGRPWVEVVRDHDLNELIRGVTRDAAPRAATVTLDAQGGVRTFAVQGSVARRPDGDDDLRAVFVFHDVTALKKLERVRSDFIANVSHELRTPLTAIIGYLEALLDGAKDDAGQRDEFLRTIKTHADRLDALVQDLLQLSQIESGEYQWRREPVDVVGVVRRCAEMIEPLARRRRIAVTCASEAPVLHVTADEEKLTQVFVNLLDNAVKYTEPGGSVEVSVIGADDRVVIRVRDTGIGVAPADRDRIFERFFRVDRARSRESGGTGLGLSIVKHVVEAHGGTVGLESRLGHGATFTVTLPRGSEPRPT